MGTFYVGCKVENHKDAKKVAVVPSRTVPQGLAAMLSLQPDGELDSVSDKMIKALSTVLTGEITTAVRNVEIDGVNYVSVNNPWPPNVGDQYTKTYDDYVSGSDHTHWDDYYNVTKQ